MSERPYQPPAAPSAQDTVSRRGHLWLTALAALPAVGVAVLALIFVPQFDELHSAIRGELPNPTRILLATYRWWVLIALGIVAAGVLGPQTRRSRVVLLCSGTAIALLMFAFAVWSAYLPVIPLATRA
jgi:hypothetical protein